MKTLLIVLTMIGSYSADAQVLGSFFSQKKTKLKYIAQQIAALEVYASYLKKGYKVVDKGWTTINDIKHGEFKLDDDEFSSLEQVSGTVKGYTRVDDIVSLQIEISKGCSNLKDFTGNNENITTEERKYTNAVLANLLNKCAEDLHQLKLIMSDDSLALKDDERLRKIDELYTSMQDKHSFVKHFQQSVQALALSRKRETMDINKAELLYDINSEYEK